MTNFRFTLRQLARSPVFTAMVVASTALGVGATTTVFCWMQAILFHPVPGADREEQLAVLTTLNRDAMWDCVSLPDLQDSRELRGVFADVIGSQVTPACLRIDDRLEWIYGQVTTANFFTALGVQPLLGRTFRTGEDVGAGQHPVMVVSETFWRSRLGADPAIVGKQVELNQHAFTVIGVTPAAFPVTMSGLRCDFWAPIAMHQEVAGFGTITPNRHDRWLHTQVRLQPGVSRATAQAAVDVLSARLAQTHPDSNRDIRLRVLPFSESPYGAQPLLGPVLRLLLAVSFGVLLIVAANTSNLLLVRATARQKEIAVRLAIGAGRRNLAALLFTESLVLALAGGVLGIVLANFGLGALEAWFPQTYLPIGFAIAMDPMTLAFALLVAVATGFVFGLAPLWHAHRTDVNATLKQGGRSSGAGASPRLRRVFVVSQVALSVVLLAGAGLCVKSVRQIRQANFGCDPQGILLAGLRIGMNGYDEASGKGFYRELQQRMAQLPGVESAALASWYPLGFEGTGSHGVSVAGHLPQPGESDSVMWAAISPGYFPTLRIPLVAGRDFTAADDEHGPRVAIINEAMARRYWPGQPPVGRVFKDNGREVRVVGVAADGKYRSLNEPPRCFFYRPYLQGIPDLNLAVAVRTHGDPAALANSVRREIRALDAGVDTWALIPMVEYVKAASSAAGLAARLLTVLGVVALVLAALGIYGVMAYVVSLRTHEYGVRTALGAAPADLRRLVLREGLLLAGIGIALGLVLALPATRFLASLLYGVRSFDAAILSLVSVALAAAALLASWIPAQRATRVEPLEALRAE
ncbi:permease [Opitutus sp. ER46]|nr:permease [Opitutus sp. ER46]